MNTVQNGSASRPMNINIDKIGVAVVGLGVGEQHASAYLGSRACKLKWLYDKDRNKARAVRERLGGGEISSGYDDILNDSDVHAISIASYDDDHFHQVVSALEAGKHVFVEKPICQTRDELAAIKSAWLKADKKLKLYSNLVLRSAPLYKWLERQISSGEFGDLYSFDGDYLYGRLRKITKGWRKDVDKYSVMMGGGVHIVDLMLWLTGERPSRVHAIGNRICTKETAFRYNDYVSATVKFISGMVGRITANFGCVHRHQHALRIFGTKKTFIYDDAGSRLHSGRESSTLVEPIDLNALPGSKGELISSFISAIVNDKETENTTQSFFDSISVCYACDRALGTEEEMEIDYI